MFCNLKQNNPFALLFLSKYTSGLTIYTAGFSLKLFKKQLSYKLRKLGFGVEMLTDP